MVKVALAVTAMVVVAFAVPLGLVVRETARDRAVSHAERQAAALGPALTVTTERAALERAVQFTTAGSEGRMAVHVPADGDRPALTVGTARASARDLASTRRLARAVTTATPGGQLLLQPTALSGSRTAVVEVYVPEAEAGRGVAAAWLMLAGVAVALVIGSVAVADRLGVRLVGPARRLARGGARARRGLARGAGPRGGPGRTAAGGGRVQLHGRPGGGTPRQRTGAGRRSLAPPADPAHRAPAQRGLPRRGARRRADPGRRGAAGVRGGRHHPHRPRAEAPYPAGRFGGRVRRGRGHPGADGVLVGAGRGRGAYRAGGGGGPAGTHPGRPG
ncbi:histidine kinase [Streptomyces sp. FR-008]|nr:histidine kinase [Streptomyces sp. FR-008]